MKQFLLTLIDVSKDCAANFWVSLDNIFKKADKFFSAPPPEDPTDITQDNNYRPWKGLIVVGICLMMLAGCGSQKEGCAATKHMIGYGSK